MSSKVNNSFTIHQGSVFKLVSENVTLPNGTTINMDVIRHPGAAIIIPLSDKTTILLIKQFRHALGDFIWEIPTGTLNEKEKAIECAKRELIEETGYSANEWHKVGEIIPLPAYSDMTIELTHHCVILPTKNGRYSQWLKENRCHYFNFIKLFLQRRTAHSIFLVFGGQKVSFVHGAKMINMV